MRISAISVAALLAVASASAQAETGRSTAPNPVLDAFSLRAGHVQQILLPPGVGETVSVAIELGGAMRLLELRRHSVVTRNFKLLVDDGKTLTEIPNPAPTTFRGQLAGLDGSLVAAQIANGQITATIVMPNGAAWGVEPINAQLESVPLAAHLVYRKADVVLPKDIGCGVTDKAAPIDRPGGSNPTALRSAELAVDADNAFYVRNGQNATNTRNAVTRVLNVVDVIYKRDVELCHKMNTLIIRTQRVYTGQTTQALLLEMRARWSSQHGNIQRDTAHMFTGVGAFQGVIGTAYLSAICSTSIGYGVSKAFHSSTTINALLVAHELGHNWGMGHCSGSNCFIMCASLGGCGGNAAKFGGVSIATIKRYAGTRACLRANCAPPPKPGKWVAYGKGCKGTVQGPGACAQLNGNGGTLRTLQLPNEYCYAVKMPKAGTITGFELFTRTFAPGNRTMTCALYRQATTNNGPDVRSISTGKMTVTNTAGFHRVLLGNPVIVKAGESIWISQYDTNNVLAASLTTGANPPAPTYWRRTAGGNGRWATTGLIPHPSYRVLCTGGGDTVPPELSNSGVPEIGKSFQVRLTKAKASSPTVLIIGSRRTNVPIPATNNCFLLTDVLVTLPGNTDSSGTRSVTIGLPNQKFLATQLFRAQYVVVDKPVGNVLGVVTSNGGEGTIGG